MSYPLLLTLFVSNSLQTVTSYIFKLVKINLKYKMDPFQMKIIVFRIYRHITLTFKAIYYLNWKKKYTQNI